MVPSSLETRHETPLRLFDPGFDPAGRHIRSPLAATLLFSLHWPSLLSAGTAISARPPAMPHRDAPPPAACPHGRAALLHPTAACPHHGPAVPPRRRCFLLTCCPFFSERRRGCAKIPPPPPPCIRDSAAAAHLHSSPSDSFDFGSNTPHAYPWLRALNGSRRDADVEDEESKRPASSTESMSCCRSKSTRWQMASAVGAGRRRWSSTARWGRQTAVGQADGGRKTCSNQTRSHCLHSHQIPMLEPDDIKNAFIKRLSITSNNFTLAIVERVSSHTY